MKNTENQQIPFEFDVANYMRREDFMVSQCNECAFKMLDAWPNWLSPGLVIYGPKGCGKSHLAHLWADKIRQMAEKPIKVSLIEAGRINLRNVTSIAKENQSIVVENLTPKANNEALFHLFNMYNESGRYMLWTAESTPCRMNFALKDLQSRLNMLPSVEISEPDDFMLQMLVVKLFNDRQIMITEDILNYIVNNAQRSFAYIMALVEEIDVVSLALKSNVNYKVVRQAMDNLRENEDKEPDLFDEW